jgi:recombination associated protein RdgC
MKNAIVYRIPEFWPTSVEALSMVLHTRRFVGCSPTDAESSGWVYPAKHSAGLAHQVGRHIVITLQTETKILPASVVNRYVSEKVESFEREEGRRVGRKERSEIAEALRLALLSKAFSKIGRTTAYLDTKASRMVVDTSSAKRADDLACKLLEIGGITIRKFMTTERPEIAMRRWLSGDVPDAITIDDECELVGQGDDRPTVKYQRHSLDGEDVREHLSCGKMPTRAAITYIDRASFVLTDDLHIKRFALVDTMPVEQGDSPTEEERFDADVALYASEMAGVIGWIEDALGGPAEEKPSTTTGAGA